MIYFAPFEKFASLSSAYCNRSVLWHLERHEHDLPVAIFKNIFFRAALLGYLARTANLAYPSVTMGISKFINRQHNEVSKKPQPKSAAAGRSLRVLPPSTLNTHDPKKSVC